MTVLSPLAVTLPINFAEAVYSAHHGFDKIPRGMLIIEQAVHDVVRLSQVQGIFADTAVKSVLSDGVVLETGETLHGSFAAQILRNSSRVFVYCITLGPDISAQIDSLSQGGELLFAHALDITAFALLVCAETALVRHIKENGSLDTETSLTPNFSPGCGDLSMDTQSVIFKHLDASRIGVTLSAASVMRPLKTVSGFIGTRPGSSVPAAKNSCAFCSNKTCPSRRLIQQYEQRFSAE